MLLFPLIPSHIPFDCSSFFLDVSYLPHVDFFFFFKQKTAYEMRISDWSSDVCSSDLSFAPDRPGDCRCTAAKPHRRACLHRAEGCGLSHWRQEGPGDADVSGDPHSPQSRTGGAGTRSGGG